MEKIIKVAKAMLITYIVVCMEYKIIGYEEWWVSLSVSIILGYRMLLTKDSLQIQERKVWKEYILNLQNNTIGEHFNAKKYPSYKKQYSSKEGNDYVSPSGDVISTKYILEKEVIRSREYTIAEHLFCIFMIGIIFVLWEGLIKNGQMQEIINIRMMYVWDKIQQRRVIIKDVLFLQIQENSSEFINQGKLLWEGILENIRTLLLDLQNRF